MSILETPNGNVTGELTTVLAFVICGLLLTVLFALVAPFGPAAFGF